MAADPDDSVPEIGDLLNAELRRRGMSEAEIKAALKKRKRRQMLELNAVRVPTYGVRTPPSPASRAEELVTVEFAAGQLKLHAKTVLRFIKEGRLRATRVGKSYRILRADLDAFGGLPARAEPAAEDARVTSIVDVPGVGPALAQKWSATVAAALQSRQARAAPLRADVIYEAERAHLKIVVVGPPSDTVNLLGLIRVWIEQLQA